MVATISPSAVSGTITVPASKSSMQRACALALLHKGKTFIYNPGKSDDEISAVNIIKDLGAQLTDAGNVLSVESNGSVSDNNAEINCGESGLCLRMFAPIAALRHSPVLLKGEGSLLKRPVHFMDEVFPLLSVRCESNGGFLPVKIHGPLLPVDIQIDGSKSSQYLTGLLFALAKSVKKQVVVGVSNLTSKPYIDLSLQMLKHFGYHVYHDQYKIFYIEPFASVHEEIHYHTEGDWSGASFFLVAAAVAGSITLRGLQDDSMQADKEILHVLKSVGAGIHVNELAISVTKTDQLKPFSFDATHSPDLFLPLVALAANCEGVSAIRGISRLREKESNRAETLVEVFTKMGVEIIVKDDTMIIEGKSRINGALLTSHNDHRIAMACSIAALNASGPVIIEHAEAVNKSYPEFYNHLKMLGAAVSLASY